MISITTLISKSFISRCYSASRLSISTGHTEYFVYLITYFSTSNDGNKISNKNVELPEEPQNCCMSGCANCVWIAYAEELAKILNDEGKTAKQKILEQVKDPNLRAFLMVELHHLFKEKK